MSNISKIKLEGNLIFMDPIAKSQLKEAGKHSHVELDFKEVIHIDSTGVDLILNIARKIKKNNGSLRIINVNKQATEIMEICGLDKIAEIFSTEDDHGEKL